MVAVQRVALQLLPRRAPPDSAKIAPISRAEGGQLQAPVGPPPVRVCVSGYYPTFHRLIVRCQAVPPAIAHLLFAAVADVER